MKAASVGVLLPTAESASASFEPGTPFGIIVRHQDGNDGIGLLRGNGIQQPLEHFRPFVGWDAYDDAIRHGQRPVSVSAVITA